MNSTVIKVISGVLAFFILIYVGFQVYSYAHSPYKTETVFESTVADSVEAKGTIFRDETVVKAKKSRDGIVSFYYPNGSKVAKSAAVARIYNSAEDLEKSYKIEQVADELSMLKECKASASGSAQNDLLTKQLDEEQLSLTRKIVNHDLSELSASKYEILKTLNKIQLLTGELKSLDSRISKLSAQKKKLEASISSADSTVRASASGFFVDETDGLEIVNGFSKAMSQSESSLKELQGKQAKAVDSAVGKIITSYEWRFVVSIDKSEASRFSEGQQVSIVFSTFADETVDAVIDRVKEPNSNGRSTVVLKSDLMDENIALLRTDKVKISFKNNSGLKVSKKALYIENGVKGVYCLLGKDVIFKKVDVIYESDDFFLSTPHYDDGDYLKIYDDVIIKGKDLYDKQRAEQ